MRQTGNSGAYAAVTDRCLHASLPSDMRHGFACDAHGDIDTAMAMSLKPRQENGFGGPCSSLLLHRRASSHSESSLLAPTRVHELYFRAFSFVSLTRNSC